MFCLEKLGRFARQVALGGGHYPVNGGLVQPAFGGPGFGGSGFGGPGFGSPVLGSPGYGHLQQVPLGHHGPHGGNFFFAILYMHHSVPWKISNLLLGR